MTDNKAGSGRRSHRSIARWIIMVAVISVIGSAYALLTSNHSVLSGSADSLQHNPALITEGAVVYGEHCQICHGATGQGGTGPNLADGLAERYPDPADQRQIILDGPKSMPSFESRLTDREIDAVIEFTRFGL